MSSSANKDEGIPTNTEAYYEKVVSEEETFREERTAREEEIYREKTEEELRASLTSDDPSPGGRGI